MTNEAPLPDEVTGLPANQDAANRLISVAIRELKRKKDKGDIAARITLDHIAALEEQIKLMSKHQAGVDEKLCELEAENKRLVDILEELKKKAMCSSGTTNLSYAKSGLMNCIERVEKYLAQTGEK